MTAAFFKRQARIVAFIASVLLNLMVAPAFAACSTPAGNEGDINYVSSLHVMVYCNGTSWIGMGVSQPVSYGTLTLGDFCTATSSSAIACTTAGINLASQVTGTLGTINGGTGLAAYTTGDMLYASATNTLSKLSIGTTGWVLTASPSGPTWSASASNSVGSFSAGTTGFTPATATTGAVTLAGTLGVANGGTGTATALTKGSVVIAGTSGVYTQDNANFFYDATNHRLGLGTATPTQGLIVFGNIDAGGTNGYLTEITNAGTTGTTVNKLAKLNNSGAAIIAATADIDGMLGIVVGETAGGTSAVTTGSAQIATSGQASCVFDGQTVPGDYVSISATVAGDCLDGGTSRPLTNQTIGRVLTANSGVGTTATVALGLSGSGNGGVPTGTIMAFASTTCPVGWTEYTAARGYFLRGRDPSGSTSVDPSGIRAIGNVQLDTVGPFTMMSNGYQGISPGGGAGAYSASVVGSPQAFSYTGTVETRPRNIAVTFCQYTGGSPVTTTASGTANFVARWTNATTLGTGTLFDNGTNVGIGTTSPNATLDVENSSSAITYPILINNPTSGTNIAAAGTEFAAHGRIFASILGGQQTNTTFSNGTLGFYTEVGDAMPASPQLFIQGSTGNVGIGTTAPISKLHVAGGNINLTNTDWVAGTTGSALTTYMGTTSGNTYSAFQAYTAGASTVGNLVLNAAGGNVGINQSSPAYSLDVNGTVRFLNLLNASGVGTVCIDNGYPISWIASNTCVPSDRRLKERIMPLAPALDLIGQLKPVTYYWNAASKNPDKRRRIGLIAQDVEPLIPEVVNTDGRGFKSISYDYLAAPIIKAVQELKSLFDADHDAIAQLRADNDNLRAANDNETAQIKALTARLDAIEASHH
jgi:hypothetical protein